MNTNSRFRKVAVQLSELDSTSTSYATSLIDTLLGAARQQSASDIHIQPVVDGLEIRWRLDGVLQRLGTFPSGQTADVVTRLKVMAGLLTYQNDIPQEGRIRDRPGDMDMRVSTFPSLHGERAVVRLFASSGELLSLDALGLPAEVETSLRALLVETSGAILVTGPAGSGKTTTVYAALREIVDSCRGEKSIVSLEDPIESAVDGVAQSQVKPTAGFSLASGLRSLMRQDPEVILVGEIRDHETAETVFQASLTGHLVLTTFHAGSAAGAISRLSDMGIEPYLLRSGILAILGQRLVRRLCNCAVAVTRKDDMLGLRAASAKTANGCALCHDTGYRGRTVLCELLEPQANQVGRAILSRQSADQLEQLAVESGMVTRWARAIAAVEAGVVSPAEIRRVLGLRGDSKDR